jgi:indolepyruvate decarboxylase
VLITGEGSHQLTAQEVGQFHGRGLKPIIFLLNNNGYLIERLLCKNGETYYNDLAQWHYHLLPQALGCENVMAPQPGRLVVPIRDANVAIRSED